MSQTAKAQEPSMEEILASIRRIIADDEGGKTAKAPDPAPAPPPAPKPVPAPPPVAVRPVPAPGANSQDDVDAMLADDLNAAPEPVAVKPEPVNPAAVPSGGDVLDLTEAMAAPAPAKPAPSFRTIDASSDVVFADRPHESPAEPVLRTMDEARRAFTQSTPDRGLLSNAAASAVDNAFNSLAHTVLGNNARTLEDLVKEMLRPMLKAWLDDNLPGLVERIVRAEIERVSRGRG
jgi:cell pole-organizing protein PopZ